MKHFLLVMLLLLPATAWGASDKKPDYSHWTAAIVAGDNHAHDGGHSEVFDNARKALATAFTKIGFSPANMIQFSMQPTGKVKKTSATDFANDLWNMSARAPAGCLIYFTSHGTEKGLVVGNVVVSPRMMKLFVDNACGSKPSVVVVSACFSGQFVPVLAGDNRVVITASSADRASFGCGALNTYTYFDDCFLRALPKADGFARLGKLVQECVAFREKQTGAKPPSDPQVSVGKNVKNLKFTRG